MHDLFTLATRAALVAGVLLSLIAVSEVLDLYLSLQQLSPLAASLFALTVLFVVVGGIVYLGVQWYAHPPVLMAPPRTEDLARDVQHHARYLAHYLQRLADNPQLDAARAADARVAARRLTDAIDLPAVELTALVRGIEETAAKPLVADLRGRAEGVVRSCVRDVMAGVTLSPYRSSDLLVVLYRNGAMVLQLTALYGGRPRRTEQLAIIRDTLRVVAAVNFLNFGNKLLEGILGGVPMVGRFADDVAQGIGAGFLTSAVGHAAMERCESFHGWERTAAVATLRADSRRFLEDVRDIFLKDVYPSMRGRLGDLWDRFGTVIRTRLDAMVTTEGLVAAPVADAGGGMLERFGQSRARAGVAWQRLTNRTRARFTRRSAPEPPTSEPPPPRS